jgi:hypothetical protein
MWYNITNVDLRFLLAALQMNTLIYLLMRGDIKQALRNLAKGIDGLDETCKQAMERIEDLGKRSRELAKQILTWITYAKRPLSTKELRNTLAVMRYTTKLNEDYLPSVKTSWSICAGLVSTDEKTDIIRLVHYTAQEYFEQMSSFPKC